MNDNTWGPIIKYNSLFIATILLIKTKKGGKTTRGEGGKTTRGEALPKYRKYVLTNN